MLQMRYYSNMLEIHWCFLCFFFGQTNHYNSYLWKTLSFRIQGFKQKEWIHLKIQSEQNPDPLKIGACMSLCASWVKERGTRETERNWDALRVSWNSKWQKPFPSLRLLSVKTQRQFICKVRHSFHQYRKWRKENSFSSSLSGML